MRGKDSETTETHRRFVWLLVHWEIPAEDLEDGSTDISRRSDKEQGRSYCANVKNVHNLIWHQYADITLWDKVKVVRNLLLVSLLHPPFSLGLFQLWSIRILYCKIEVKFFSLFPQPVVVRMWSCCQLFGVLEFWRHILCLGIPANPPLNSSKLEKKEEHAMWELRDNKEK